MKLRFEVFRESANARRGGVRVGKPLWYWRLVRQNGKIVADGGEGYSTSSNAKKSIKNLLRGLGVNVTGRGWRARLMRDHGVAITVKEL